MDAQQLTDLYEIERLKARYCFFLDTQQWHELRGLFTDDVEMYYEESVLPSATTPTITGADDLVGYLSSSGPEKTSIHQVHASDIEFVDADTATGIWAMSAWTDDRARGFALKLYGHYHDRCVRGGDGRWRIAAIRVTRLRQHVAEPVRDTKGPLLGPDE